MVRRQPLHPCQRCRSCPARGTRIAPEHLGAIFRRLPHGIHPEQCHTPPPAAQIRRQTGATGWFCPFHRPCIRDSPAGKSAPNPGTGCVQGTRNPRPCTCSTGALLVGCDDMVSTSFYRHGTASAARHEAAFFDFDYSEDAEGTATWDAIAAIPAARMSELGARDHQRAGLGAWNMVSCAAPGIRWPLGLRPAVSVMATSAGDEL